MKSYTTKYPKSHWDPIIINYIGLKTGTAYYKSYVSKCLITKLNSNNKYDKYDRFDFDDEFQNIIKNKMNTEFLWKFSSINGLNNLLSYFKSDVSVETASIYTINFNENGNNIHELLI
jgi:hypothetical protein